MQERYIEYMHDDVRLEGYMAYDERASGPLPAVLIAHTWEGRGEFVCDKARALAGQGYVGFAADLYGRGVLGTNAEENAALMQPLLDDRALLQARMHAALAAIGSQVEVDDDRVAAIGYCFGGLCVLDLARTGAAVRGVVSLHGLLGAPGNLADEMIAAKVLILHGHADPMAPTADVIAIEEELTRAGADWQIHVYGNTMHSFTNPNANDPSFGTVYSAVADRRSWQSLVNFLAEIF